MKKNNLTDEELKLLKAIFYSAETFIGALRQNRYDVDFINLLCGLKEKLGIYDLLEE